MLTIIRKAPLRKIDNVTYGDARYGGTNRAKYDGYQEQEHYLVHTEKMLCIYHLKIYH
jgi:hypothetical protein